MKVENSILASKIEARLIAANRPNLVTKEICNKLPTEWGKFGELVFPKSQKANVIELTSYDDVLPAYQRVAMDEATFSPDVRVSANFYMNLDDIERTGGIDQYGYIVDQIKLDIEQKKEERVMELYDQATIVLRDGDLATPTNGGGVNPVLVTADTWEDFEDALKVKFDTNNIPYESQGGWVMLTSTQQNIAKNSLIKALGGGALADAEFRSGSMVSGKNGFKFLRSNLIPVVTGVRYQMAGAGKPVQFAEVVNERVFVGSINEHNDYKMPVKITSFFDAFLPEGFAQNVIRIETVA